ncbi:MAG: undecaprenyl-diphosphatase [Candidatus Azotimanducaceae bacterium]|jgi:undecaprenyl-diphosphatase
MLDTLIQIDQDLFLWLNNLGTETFDWFWKLITGKSIWIPLYLFLVFVLFKKHDWKTASILLLGGIAAVGFADLISVHAFKNVFERFRPCHESEIKEFVRVVKGCGGKYGFVSSHASNSFAVAMYFYFVFANKNLKGLWLLPLWAAIVAYSRIYVGVHYPLDIICGGILGFILALGSWKLFTNISERINA